MFLLEGKSRSSLVFFILFFYLPPGGIPTCEAGLPERNGLTPCSVAKWGEKGGKWGNGVPKITRVNLEIENIPVRGGLRGSWGASGGLSPAEGAAGVQVSWAESQP